MRSTPVLVHLAYTVLVHLAYTPIPSLLVHHRWPRVPLLDMTDVHVIGLERIG